MPETTALDAARALAAAQNTMDLRDCLPEIMRSLPDDMIRILALGHMQAALRSVIEAYDLELSHQAAGAFGE